MKASDVLKSKVKGKDAEKSSDSGGLGEFEEDLDGENDNLFNGIEKHNDTAAQKEEKATKPAEPRDYSKRRISDV